MESCAGPSSRHGILGQMKTRSPGSKTLPPLLVAMLATGFSAETLRAAQTFPIIGTGQSKCYDNRSEITPPKPGQPFFGQDAQFHAHPGQLHPQRRRVDGARQHHRPDLAAQPGYGRRWITDAPRQADPEPGSSTPGQAQCGEVRWLRRLAAAIHQGAVFALRRARHGPERTDGRGHFAPHALH